jgi:hypothetical protein
VLRIALEEPMVPDAATKGLKALLVSAGEASSFSELEKQLFARQDGVRAALNRTLRKET